MKLKSLNKFCLVLFGLVFLSLPMIYGFSEPISSVKAEEVATGTEIPFDREQIKIDRVTLTADALFAKAGESVALNFQVEPFYSAETITSIEYKIVSGKNYATVSNDGILSIDSFAKAYDKVVVKVIVNNVESNIVIVSISKTPVEEFEIVASKTTIREGGNTQLSVSKLLPETSSFKTVSYEIVEGSEFATIDSFTGFVQVNSEISNANATVKVRALTSENFETSSNVITLSIYVPVKNMVLTASSYKVSISSLHGSYVSLSATASGVVSDFNPIYKLDPDYNGVATLTDNVLYIHSNLSKNYIIPIWAEQDGAESNTIFIEVYILTEEIQLKVSENITEISQFLTYDFSAKTYPTYANSQTFNYLLTLENGEQFMHAGVNENGIVWVGDFAPAGTKLKLTISNADITRIIYLTVLEYDTKTISLITSELPNILYPTNEVTFTAMLDGQFTTNNHFTVEYEFGDREAFTIVGNKIVVKPLTELEYIGKNELSFNVRLKSLNGEYSAVQNFTVKLPVVTLQNQTIYVDRGDTVYVTMLFNNQNFASNKTLKELTNLVVNGETVIIRKSNTIGQIEIILPTNLRYSFDNFSFPVYSEDGNRTCTITVVINELDTNKIVAELASVDSENYEIDLENPQLWTNRSIKTTFYYNGKGGLKLVYEYGLKWSSTIVMNADLNRESNELTLTATENSHGKIYYLMEFYDGLSDKTHIVERNNITIFNPASLTDAVYIPGNSITMYNASFDLNTVFKYNDEYDSTLTKWVTTGGKVEVSYNNVLKIITSTPWTGFDAVIHYSQTYNGKTFEMGQTSFRVNIGFSKTAFSVYKPAGTNYDLWVKGLNDEFAKTDGFLGIGNHGPLGTDSNELSGGVTFGQFLNIGYLFDWQKLKDVGFTKIRFTLNVDISEYEDGYQEIYALLDNDTNLAGFSYSEVFRNGYVEHTRGAKDTSFWTHTFTFEVSINLILQKPNLIIAAGAHGNGNDTWSWGYTTINFEAVA